MVGKNPALPTPEGKWVIAQLEIVGGFFAIAHLENLSGQSTGAHNKSALAWCAAHPRLHRRWTVSEVLAVGCGLGVTSGSRRRPQLAACAADFSGGGGVSP